MQSGGLSEGGSFLAALTLSLQSGFLGGRLELNKDRLSFNSHCPLHFVSSQADSRLARILQAWLLKP